MWSVLHYCKNATKKTVVDTGNRRARWTFKMETVGYGPENVLVSITIEEHIGEQATRPVTLFFPCQFLERSIVFRTSLSRVGWLILLPKRSLQPCVIDKATTMRSPKNGGVVMPLALNETKNPPNRSLTIAIARCVLFCNWRRAARGPTPWRFFRVPFPPGAVIEARDNPIHIFGIGVRIITQAPTKVLGWLQR